MGGGGRMRSTQASRDAAAERVEDARGGNGRATASGVDADRSPRGLKSPRYALKGARCGERGPNIQEEPPEGFPSGGSLFPTLRSDASWLTGQESSAPAAGPESEPRR